MVIFWPGAGFEAGLSEKPPEGLSENPPRGLSENPEGLGLSLKPDGLSLNPLRLGFSRERDLDLSIVNK